MAVASIPFSKYQSLPATTHTHPSLQCQELDTPSLPKRVRAHRQRKKKNEATGTGAALDDSNGNPPPVDELPPANSRPLPLGPLELAAESEKSKHRQLAHIMKQVSKLTPCDQDSLFMFRNLLDEQGDDITKRIEVAIEVKDLLEERIKLLNKAQEARKLVLDQKCVFTKTANEARAASQLTAQANRTHALREIVQQVRFSHSPSPAFRRAKRSVLPGLTDENFRPMALLDVYKRYHSSYCGSADDNDTAAGHDDDSLLNKSESDSNISQKEKQTSKLLRSLSKMSTLTTPGQPLKLEEFEQLRQQAVRDFINAPVRSPSHVKRRRKKLSDPSKASPTEVELVSENPKQEFQVRVTEWEEGQVISEKVSKLQVKENCKSEQRSPARTHNHQSTVSIQEQTQQRISEKSPLAKERQNDKDKQNPSLDLLSAEARTVMKSTDQLIQHSSENPAYLHIRANRRQAYETAKKLGNDPALFSVAQSVFYDHSNQLPSLMAEARRDLSRRLRGAVDEKDIQARTKEVWDCLNVPILLRIEFRILVADRTKQSSDKMKPVNLEEEMVRAFESVADSLYYFSLLKAMRGVLTGQPTASVMPLPEDLAAYLTLVQAYRSPKPQEVMLDWVTDLLQNLKARCRTFIEKISKYNEEGKTKNPHVACMMNEFVTSLVNAVE